MTFTHFDFEYIDIHTHFFPPSVFKAIWDYFEMPDGQGHVRGWPIYYKRSTDDLVNFLTSQNVKAFTTYNYAHKAGVATFINEWTAKFIEKQKKAIPFGCVWPDDKDLIEYVTRFFDEFNFKGIKVQPLVQNFYAHDERMDPVYDIIVDRGKWYTIHAGTAPYRNAFVGFKHFKKFLDKYPDMNIIVAHFGAYEYKKFLNLLDKHENIYLDTAMVYIPNNIFPERKVKQPKIEDLLSYQDRILFGSDYPNIPYEYQNSTRGFLELDLPRSFYENIFFNNANRLFQII